MRRAVLALALVVGLAGCAASDPSTLDVPATTTTTAAGQAPVTAVPTTHRPADGGGTAPAPRPGSSGTSGRPVGGPGSIADLLLGPKGPSQLVVQVLTQAGAEPRQATLDRVVAVLGQASGKPVRTIGGSVAGRTTWSGADLRAAADAQADSAALRLLFVHGRSDQGADVLGITVRGDVAAVFVDQVEAAATGLVGPAVIERAVTVHELGHVLGLVDLFLHTGRADPDHPGHSTNPRSVMYWAVESSLISDLLSGGPPQDFDDADRADLATIRRG
ncbi:MAG: Membrane metalloprotease [Actinomycetia bacterium]|nr:Membrane metalloprotease [Actinomycetes bacterium]